MAYEFIRYEVADHIATLTLARPDKMNAISGAMVREMIAAFQAADADDAVRCVIVTGEGRAFCAGADLSRGTDSFVAPGSAALTNEDGTPNYASQAMREVGGHLAMTMFNLTKPVIGAINGAAAGMGATLTLPGIAGLVLTIGMAVDANVLVYERIREELRIAKSPARAIELGYERALSAIIDANLTTLITAGALFFFGAGPVRGFAIVLGIGIVSSVFTAIYVTRFLVEVWHNTRQPKTMIM